mmetsp:Transcript_22487/g.53276  ORF Transcript_22487/g.53276 Transcript_22487/m.53276 type:complete len:168 (+) Transcript_22487:1099-1602(+)
MRGRSHGGGSGSGGVGLGGGQLLPVVERTGMSSRYRPWVETGGATRVYSVPYSEHSSFDEICEFVKVCKPRTLIPTVNADTRQETEKARPPSPPSPTPVRTVRRGRVAQCPRASVRSQCPQLRPGSCKQPRRDSPSRGAAAPCRRAQVCSPSGRRTGTDPATSSRSM